MKQARSPMLTTEPVLTEVAYFLRADRVDVDPLFQLLERGAVRLDLQVAEHWPRLRTLMSPALPSTHSRPYALQHLSTERQAGD